MNAGDNYNRPKVEGISPEKEFAALVKSDYLLENPRIQQYRKVKICWCGQSAGNPLLVFRNGGSKYALRQH